jgi:hypothetical protein
MDRTVSVRSPSVDDCPLGSAERCSAVAPAFASSCAWVGGDGASALSGLSRRSARIRPAGLVTCHGSLSTTDLLHHTACCAITRRSSLTQRITTYGNQTPGAAHISANARARYHTAPASRQAAQGPRLVECRCVIRCVIGLRSRVIWDNCRASPGDHRIAFARFRGGGAG